MQVFSPAAREKLPPLPESGSAPPCAGQNRSNYAPGSSVLSPDRVGTHPCFSPPAHGKASPPPAPDWAPPCAAQPPLNELRDGSQFAPVRSESPLLARHPSGHATARKALA